MKFNYLIETLGLDLIEKVFPSKPAIKTRGRPVEVNIKDVFKSIFYKLVEGVRWHSVPIYSNYSSSSVYDYFKKWTEAGIFSDLYYILLELYDVYVGIDYSLLAGDSTLIKSKRGGECNGRNPCDRGRLGCKISSITDKVGIGEAFGPS